MGDFKSSFQDELRKVVGESVKVGDNELGESGGMLRPNLGLLC